MSATRGSARSRGATSIAGGVISGGEAVVGARVSHLDDDKDNTRKISHLAQTEEGERWSQAQGYTVVGRFEDLGISAGKTTPLRLRSSRRLRIARITDQRRRPA